LIGFLAWCDGLTEVDLTCLAGATTVGPCVLWGCEALTRVILPAPDDDATDYPYPVTFSAFKSVRLDCKMDHVEFVDSCRDDWADRP
jgi:hypothetical protein